MNEITLEGKKYLSSKKAAEITGYSKDYVGQLCREGRVKARLVGRNWYVLEDSIHEHRFGKKNTSESAENGSQKAENAWEMANYSHEEEVAPLPTLIFQEKIQEINILDGRNPLLSEELAKDSAKEKAQAIPVSEKLIEEMHSAWKDWFSTIPEEKIATEPIYEEEETPVMLEKVEDEEVDPVKIEKIEEPEDENAEVQVNLHKVDEKEEEIVPIHRSFTAPARYTPVYNSPILPEQGRILQERVVTQKKPASAALRSLFIVLGLVAVASTVIGSGYASSYLEKYNLNITPFQYLAGEHSIN